ncbi:hypothetical protein [Clostridium paraputrificum]|uniref:Permease IIC component n=1 Tax=Clostridium paraputrificum TaxID=29363 RepID=A0A6N3CES3_9CLOT|nr:PTS transporter subunit EIIC [Clostridium sp.]MBS5987055.1 PTS sugar transporter subunit IIC [Clostridium sp.]
MMDKISAALEKYLMPVASFIGGQKHLIAIRDGFITSLTVSMTGALASMMNAVFFKVDSFIGQYLNKIDAYKSSVQPILDKYAIPVMGDIWFGTSAILSIFILLGVAYSLAKSNEMDGIGAALVALASWFTIFPQTAMGVFSKAEDGTFAEGAWGLMSVNQLGSNAMFSAMLVGLVAAQLFVTFAKKGWIIKMPEQVPPAVSKAFAALIPGGLTLVIFGIIAEIFAQAFKTPFVDWMLKVVQEPMMALGQSPLTYIFLIFIAQLLWFCGLHGSNMVDPALNTMYKTALLDNVNAVAQGKEPIYALTRNFVDVYAQPGGSGGTLALIIAIFIFSKRQEAKELAKIAVAPGIFQINEPVIFGLPIVLNATYFVPFIIAPPICLAIAWFFTEQIKFADYLCVELPWTTPPIISAFFGTAGDFKAAILAAALLVLSVVIWTPFVIAANRMGDSEQA